MTSTHINLVTSTPISLGAIFLTCAEINPYRAAITFDGRSTTFAGLADRVRRLAGALSARNIGKGDRVAYIGANHPSFLETLFATTTIGAVLVPVNSRLAAPEIAYILNDAEVSAVVISEEMAPVLRSIQQPSSWQLVAVVDGLEAAAERWLPYEDLIEAAGGDVTLASCAGEDVALIMYTSGTTGRPKGAMLTHSNLLLHHLNALHAFDIVSTDVTLVIAPLFHIGALNVLTVSTLLKAGHVILTPRFDPAAALQLIQRHQVTTVFGVPAMFNFVSQEADFDDVDLSSLRFLVCGGAPVPAPLIERYGRRGIPFVQAYGLTETAPLALVLGQDEVARRPGSAGHKKMLVSDVRLLDTKTGRPVTPGSPGEVCVRGPQVMAGYWRQPEATADVFDADGYFHTGDIAYEDADGFIYLIDRSKDMVISGGENVYPAEVEAVLYDHPAVAEAAVIGTPHDRWGEAVTAVVVLKPGATLELDELRTFSRDRLAGFKVPIRMHVLPELPRTQSGKVLKYQLRETYFD